jgi:hypothetical protein
MQGRHDGTLSRGAGKSGWIKVKNGDYWRRDAEREAFDRKHERRVRTLA